MTKAFWINVGDTYKAVKEGKKIWAPLKNKDGHSEWHWKSMENIGVGDTIFLTHHQHIVAHTTAYSGCYVGTRPHDKAFNGYRRPNDNGDGYLVHTTDIIPFDRPIPYTGIGDKFLETFNDECDYQVLFLNKKNKIRTFQGYCAALSADAGNFLFRRAQVNNVIPTSPEHILLPAGKFQEVTVKQRVNHDKWARELRKKHGKCQISGLSDLSQTIAGHIKNWSDSTPEEKTDIKNGILLEVGLATLFDRGRISFADDGFLVIHPETSLETVKFYRLDAAMKVNLLPGQEVYLAWHRQKHGF